MHIIRTGRYEVITYCSALGGDDEKPEQPTITAARAAIRDYAHEYANDGYPLDGAAIYDHRTKRCTHLFGNVTLSIFSPDVAARSTPRIYAHLSDA